MPPAKIAAIVSAILISIVVAYLEEVYVSRDLRKLLRQRQANSSPSSPPFDDWNAADQLPVMTSPYGASQVNRSLLMGQVETIDGLEVQRLDLRLPGDNLCAWSPDGKTLYVAGKPGLLRIDAATWQVTHQLDLSIPSAAIHGVVLTSEGVVVALRGVTYDDRVIPTASGEGMQLIDPRTGLPLETRSYRALVVADPNNLQVVRQFIGPSKQLAGAPASPVVCVCDDGQRGKLVDIRTGKVLQTAGRRPNEMNPDVAETDGFDEMIMSPDGKKLYHTPKSRFVYETDVSAGKFGATRELDPSGQLNANGSLDRQLLHLSHDGRYLAVNVGDDYRDGGYSIIETSGDDRDDVSATRSTAFAFIGPANRRVANSNVVEDVIVNGQLTDQKWIDYDLVVFMPLEEPDKRHQVLKQDSLRFATMLGVPTADYVLLGGGGEPAALVKVPAETPIERLVQRPVDLRGTIPDSPRKFAVRKKADPWDPDPLPTLHAPSGTSIAEENDRLYVATPDGLLSIFDAYSLEETRRIQLEPLAAGRRRKLYPTAYGLLVEQESETSFALLDYETLDADSVLEFPPGPISTTKSSDLAFVVNMANGAGSLEAYQANGGRLVARFTPEQLAELESAADDFHFGGAPVRDLDFSAFFLWFADQRRCWHLFTITDGKVAHESVRAADDSDRSSPVLLHQVREKNFCYEQGRDLRILKLPSLVDTGRTVKLDDRDKIVMFGQEGHIYCRRQESPEMRVYDMEGQTLFHGRTVEDETREIEQALALNRRPDRLFVLVDGSLHCVELATFAAE